MGSPVPVKLPVWLGVLPISHPKALFAACPNAATFQSGLQVTLLGLSGLALLPTHSPGKSHSCRSVSSMAGLYPPVWGSMSPFPQKLMSPCTLGALLLPAWRPRGCWTGLPHCRGCRHGQGVLWEKKKPNLLLFLLCLAFLHLFHLCESQQCSWGVQILLHTQLSSKAFGHTLTCYVPLGITVVVSGH